MTAFLCKEILYQNLFKSNNADSSTNDVLRPHGYQLSSCGSSNANCNNANNFHSLQDLVDSNQNCFGADFSTLARKLADLESGASSDAACSNFSSKKVRRALRASKKQASRVGEENSSFAAIQSFLFAVAEIQKLRIKLFTVNNGSLSNQIFGGKSARKICLLLDHDNNAVKVLEAAADFGFPSSSSSSPSSSSFPLLSFSKSISVESECCSFSELGEIALSLRKENSAEKETVVDQLSIHENIKQVHEELFGDDMFDNFSRSDNDNNNNDDDLNASSHSFQSENLRARKQKAVGCKLNSSSFNLELHEAAAAKVAIDHEAIEKDILSSIMSGNGAANKAQRQSAGNKKFQSKVIFEEKSCLDGRVKFYSEESDFGFIITKEGEEFFVHGDDLAKDGVDTKKLAYYARFFDIHVQFRFIQYQGKTRVNRKAVDVQISKLAPLA